MPSSCAIRGVPARLLPDAVPRIDEEDRDVGGRGAGRHVARVLLVARGVGQDEFSARRREVAVGDVDRDSLFALGPQAVREQREVDRSGASVPRRRRHRVNLILVHTARVVQQASDQRALPVVHAAGRADAEEIRHQK